MLKNITHFKPPFKKSGEFLVQDGDFAILNSLEILMKIGRKMKKHSCDQSLVRELDSRWYSEGFVCHS